MNKIHISIAAEPVFHIGKFVITNSLLTSLIVMFLLLVFALSVSRKKKVKHSGVLIVADMMIETFYDFFEKIAGEKVKVIFPLIFTFFIFIILSNWIGLFPGVGSIGFWEMKEEERILVPLFRGPNADLNTTVALALISVGVIQYLSIKSLGIKIYLSKFFNFKNPIKFFVGILELMSEISKILSFSFRLFGNIFAGEVLLIVMTFLIPILVPVPFLVLEVFVGFIQALVFAMLSTIFIIVATVHEE